MVSPTRRLRAAVGLGLAVTFTPICAQAQTPAPPSANANDSAYVDRMEKGKKLFNARNFDAAAIEFAEAYKLNPKGAPLVNEALCHKERFRYAKAVELLELALAKHGDTLDESTKKGAEAAVIELKSLLGYLILAVEPASAKVSINGEELAAGTLSKPVPLPTGDYTITATAPGFAPAEQKLRIASGDKKTLTLKLARIQGLVRAEAPDASTLILLDGAPVGRGTWVGFVPAGGHIVEFRPAEGQPQVMTFSVMPNREIVVTPSAVSAASGDKATRERPVPPKQGLYVTFGGSAYHVDITSGDGSIWSAGGALGIQLGRVGALQLTAEYSAVSIQNSRTSATSGCSGCCLKPASRRRIRPCGS